MFISKYYDTARIDELVQSKRHRNAVGGLWGELGSMQLDVLKDLGLRPNNSVLDVGCGSLRAGHLLVDYLEPNGYHGIDINGALLSAGYQHELDAALRKKLPVTQLVEHDVTRPFPIKGTFDFLIAFSLFTHLTEALTESTLSAIAEKMHTGSQLLATFFLVENGVTESQKRGSGIVTSCDQDPFQIARGAIDEMSDRYGLVAQALPHHKHPRDQSLFVLRRL